MAADHKAERAQRRLTVMSWNIRSGFGSFDLPADMSGTSQIHTIASIIRESKADVIALQEVDRHWDRSDRLDQPRALAEALEMEWWCHGANWLPQGDAPAGLVPQYGTAILSRYPILDQRNVHLPTPRGWEQRGALIAVVRLDDDANMTLINTHLQYGDPQDSDGSVEQRREQLRKVLELANQVDGPVVIAGDFNATPGSAELAEVEDSESGFIDAWVQAGSGHGGYTIAASPIAEPDRRIDYIFAGSGLTVGTASVVINDLTRIASDHYPVIAELEVAPLKV